MLSHPAPPFAVTWLALAVVVGSMGLVLPASMTLAQQAGDHARGTASSLQGGLTMLAGAIATPLTGLFGDDTMLPLAALMSAGLVAGAVLLMVVSRSRSRSRFPGQADLPDVTELGQLLDSVPAPAPAFPAGSGGTGWRLRQRRLQGGGHVAAARGGGHGGGGHGGGGSAAVTVAALRRRR